MVLPIVADMTERSPMIAVVGCGNSTRQDDGVGQRVIQILRSKGFDATAVRLLDAGTDGRP
jgi:hydrogenase maturation protease